MHHLLLITLLSLINSSLHSSEIIAKKASLSVSSDASVTDRAESLLLKGDRIGALEIINAAMTNHGPNSKSAKLLTEKAEFILRTFVTEKGQQHFQKAESLQYAGIESASDNYREALKLEPLHPIVLRGLIRSELRLGNCSQAQGALKQIEAVYTNPTDEVLEMTARVEACLSNLEKAEEAFSKISAKSSLQAITVWAQILVKRQNWIELRKVSDQLISSYPNFHESYYWRQLSKKNLNEAYDSDLAMYIEKCRKADFSVRKIYNFYPELCNSAGRFK